MAAAKRLDKDAGISPEAPCAPDIPAVSDASSDAASDDASPERIQWHPAFCSAMELELAEDAERLTFEREVNLSSKPLQADLLVVVNEGGEPLASPVARAFRRYNIMEYKSPGDALTVDDYHMGQVYCGLYKVTRADRVDGIPAEEVTLTLVREARPAGMLAALGSGRGIAAEQASPGVYALRGPMNFATQVVVTGELPEEGNVWLRALTRSMTAEQARGLVRSVVAYDDGTPQRREADAVLHVALDANEATFERADKEYADMSTFIDREVDKQRDQIYIDAIKGFTKEHGLTVSQVLNTLGVTDPVARARYERLAAEAEADDRQGSPAVSASKAGAPSR